MSCGHPAHAPATSVAKVMYPTSSLAGFLVPRVQEAGLWARMNRHHVSD